MGVEKYLPAFVKRELATPDRNCCTLVCMLRSRRSVLLIVALSLTCIPAQVFAQSWPAIEIRIEDCSPGLRNRLPGPVGQFLDDLLALPCNINRQLTPSEPAAASTENQPQNSSSDLNPKVLTIDIDLSPAVIKAGTTVNIISIVQLEGRTTPSTQIALELVILTDAGRELARASKIATGDKAFLGRYSSRFSFAVPEGLPSGAYFVEMYVHIDGAIEQKKSTGFKVAG